MQLCTIDVALLLFSTGPLLWMYCICARDEVSHPWCKLACNTAMLANMHLSGCSIEQTLLHFSHLRQVTRPSNICASAYTAEAGLLLAQHISLLLYLSFQIRHIQIHMVMLQDGVC